MRRCDSECIDFISHNREVEVEADAEITSTLTAIPHGFGTYPGGQKLGYSPGDGDQPYLPAPNSCRTSSGQGYAGAMTIIASLGLQPLSTVPQMQSILKHFSDCTDMETPCSTRHVSPAHCSRSKTKAVVADKQLASDTSQSPPRHLNSTSHPQLCSQITLSSCRPSC